MKRGQRRRFLVVRYDVTGWSEDQVDALAGEASAQGEASEDHPDCKSVSVVEHEAEIIEPTKKRTT